MNRKPNHTKQSSSNVQLPAPVNPNTISRLNINLVNSNNDIDNSKTIEEHKDDFINQPNSYE